MGNIIENIYKVPILYLLVTGGLLGCLLFYFMLKYAEEGDLLMVILIPLAVLAISVSIAKVIVPKKSDL